MSVMCLPWVTLDTSCTMVPHQPVPIQSSIHCQMLIIYDTLRSMGGGCLEFLVLSIDPASSQSVISGLSIDELMERAMGLVRQTRQIPTTDAIKHVTMLKTGY